MEKLNFFDFIVSIIIGTIIFALILLFTSWEIAVFVGATVAYLVFGIRLFPKYPDSTIFENINFCAGFALAVVGTIGENSDWKLPFNWPLIVFGVIVFFLSGGGLASKASAHKDDENKNRNN